MSQPIEDEQCSSPQSVIEEQDSYIEDINIEMATLTLDSSGSMCPIDICADLVSSTGFDTEPCAAKTCKRQRDFDPEQLDAKRPKFN